MSDSRDRDNHCTERLVPLGCTISNNFTLQKMAKRKIDNRSFQDRWEADYLFTNMKDRPVCLVCGANVAVTKECHIRRHYETKHYEKYKGLGVKQKLQVEEMKKSLVCRQTMFMKAKSKVKLL